MRFSEEGISVQFNPGAEGHTLERGGLLNVCGQEVEASHLLRAMFDPMPPLEVLYPSLVELVMCRRYEPPFCDLGIVERRLREMGLSEEGLVSIRRLLGLSPEGEK